MIFFNVYNNGEKNSINSAQEKDIIIYIEQLA